MSNDYYEVGFDFEPFTRVRSSTVDQELAGVEVGFDLLPPPRTDGTTGFSGTFTIVPPVEDDHPASKGWVTSLLSDTVDVSGSYASYQGDWVAGTYDKGVVVTHSGSDWASLVNGNTATPGTDSASWRRLTKNKIGDIVVSSSAPDSDWLEMDGSDYAIANYDATLAADLNDSQPFLCPGALSAPDVAYPSNAAAGVAAMSGDGSVFVVRAASSEYFCAYENDDGVVTKLADPSTAPSGTLTSAAISDDGGQVILGNGGSTKVTFYSNNSGTLTKLSDPATLESTSVSDVAMSSNGLFSAVAGADSPYLFIYGRSGSTWTKLSNPGTLPTGTAGGVAMSDSGDTLIATDSSANTILVYERSGSAFTHAQTISGTAITAGSAYAPAISSDGSILVQRTNTNEISVYKHSGSAYQLLQTISTAGGDTPTPTGLALSANGKILLVVGSKSNEEPFSALYYIGDASAQKIAQDQFIPDDAQGVSMDKQNGYMVVTHTGSPYATVYKHTDVDTETTFRVPDMGDAGSQTSNLYPAVGFRYYIKAR